MDAATNWIQARLFIIGVIYVLIEIMLLTRRTNNKEEVQ